MLVLASAFQISHHHHRHDLGAPVSVFSHVGVCCRTSAARRAATRWVWPMSGQCAIPREAARLSRTTVCRLPSQLHMSLVSSHLLSHGWAAVGVGFMKKHLKCSVVEVLLSVALKFIHNHKFVHL